MNLDNSPTVLEFYKSAYDRQAIWKSREDNLTFPWSDDEVLNKWQFTNVFRELDRHTKGLVVLMDKMASDSVSEATFIFNVWLYRVLDNLETWDALTCEVWLERPVKEDNSLGQFLAFRKKNNESLFTTSHVAPTLKSVIDGIQTISRLSPAIAVKLKEYASLEDASELLAALPGVSTSLAYQIALDLTYGKKPFYELGTEAWAFSSPGVLAGLELVYGYKLPPRETTMAMVTIKARQEDWFKQLGLDFSQVASSEVGLRLSLPAVAHWLTAFQKYYRIKHLNGEGLLYEYNKDR